jgi:hypothetical protein
MGIVLDVQGTLNPKRRICHAIGIYGCDLLEEALCLLPGQNGVDNSFAGPRVYQRRGKLFTQSEGAVR